MNKKQPCEERQEAGVTPLPEEAVSNIASQLVQKVTASRKIRFNMVKAEPLPSITASAQYVMWHCVEEAGAQNTVQEVVGGGKIEPQKGSAWGMGETENKKRRYLKATELIFSL